MATSEARRERRRARRARAIVSSMKRVRKHINRQYKKAEGGEFIVPMSPDSVLIVPRRRALVFKREPDARRQLDRYTLGSWGEARIMNHRFKHRESKRAMKRGFRKQKAMIRAENAKLRNPNYTKTSRYQYLQTHGESEQKAL